MNTKAKFKQPADIQFIFNRLQKAIEHVEIVKRDRKAPFNIINSISEALNLLQFQGFVDAGSLVANIPDLFAQIKYPGDKILRTEVEKDVAWIKSLLSLAEVLMKYVIENSEKVLKWSGSEDGAGA